VTTASLLLLTALGVEVVYSKFGPTIATVANTLRSGRAEPTRQRDAGARLLRNNCCTSIDSTPSCGKVYTKRPANWLDVEGAGLKRFTSDFAQSELIPSLAISTQFGKISVNRWGMRDQDYEAQPAAGVHRMALLGPSTVMGWGVGDGETFEALVENRLNRERPQAPFVKYEILNFAVPVITRRRNWWRSRRRSRLGRMRSFMSQPGGKSPRRRANLVQVVQKRIEIPYDYLRTVVQKGGAGAQDG
jgi:hypothetical protein